MKMTSIILLIALTKASDFLLNQVDYNYYSTTICYILGCVLGKYFS